MNPLLRCDVGGNYMYDGGGRPVYQEPCRNPPTHRYRGPDFVEGHWSHRCAEHVRWLSAPDLVIEPLAGDPS